MTRRGAPNPDAPEHPLMQLWIDQGQQENAVWAASVPQACPAGFEYFMRRTTVQSNQVVELGIRRVGSKPKEAADTLENKNIAELQTLAGRNGVKYDKDTTALDLVGRLRQKGVK